MVTLQPDGEESLRVSCAMIILSTLAVALRVFARSKSRAGLAAEDFLIVFALFLFYASQGVFLAALLGPQSEGTSDPNLMTSSVLDRNFASLYAQEALFVTTITVVKLSILCFYRHIFSTPKFRQIISGVGAVCMVWWILSFFMVIFQCTPIDAAWKLHLRGTPGAATCIDAGKLLQGCEIANVVIDLAILSLPIYMVRSLQMKATKKASVIAIFLLGGFACVAAIVRAYYLFDPSTGATRSFPAVFDWTAAGLAAAIVCACLPTYAALITLDDLIPKFIKSWYMSTMGNSRSSHPSNINGGSSKIHNSWKHSNATGNTSLGKDAFGYDQWDDRTYLTTQASRCPHNGAFQMGEIHVRSSVEVA